MTVIELDSGFNLYSRALRGFTAGPLKEFPSRLKVDPWQGQINWPFSYDWIRQPRCVQYDEKTLGCSLRTTIQSSWKSTSLLSFREIVMVFLLAFVFCVLTNAPQKPKHRLPIATPNAFRKNLREFDTFFNENSLCYKIINLEVYGWMVTNTKTTNHILNRPLCLFSHLFKKILHKT